MKALPPLLITATLDAGKTPYVALASTGERAVAHMQGLMAWLREPSVNRVVFAKNCFARIRKEVLEEAASRHGKELEFVQVGQDPRTLVQGKGFGEGNLISQALQKSEMLQASSGFVKITGKLHCPGAEALFSGEGSGEFFVSHPDSSARANPLRRTLSPLYSYQAGSTLLSFMKRGLRVPWGLVASAPGGLVDTRFYRVDCDFYLRVLRDSHRRVRDSLGYTLERAFHDDLKGLATSVRLIDLSPPIIGTSGSLGTTSGSYSEEIRREAEELASRLFA